MSGLRFYDACAGIGTIRMGLEQAGHQYVGSCEIDKHARKAYAAIHGAPPTHTDIRKVNPDDLPDFDILAAGFPCQAFSRAGKAGGFDDSRGTIIFELLRVAEAKTPAYLLFENVRALLNHAQGHTFEAILAGMDDVGYDAEWQVHNSKHHGVGQNRERVVLAGHSRKQRTRPLFPLVGETGGTLAVLHSGIHQRERIYSAEGVAATLQAHMGNAGDATLYAIRDMLQPQSRDNGGPHSWIYTPDEQTNALVAAKGGGKTPMVVCRDMDEWKVVGDTSLNIDANYWKGLDNRGQRPALFDGCRVRRLTPKECWRLQGIPDEYFHKAAAVVSDTQLYKLAGNACTVPLFHSIAQRMEVLAA